MLVRLQSALELREKNRYEKSIEVKGTDWLNWLSLMIVVPLERLIVYDLA